MTQNPKLLQTKTLTELADHRKTKSIRTTSRWKLLHQLEIVYSLKTKQNETT